MRRNGGARRPAEPQGKRFERNNEMTKKLMMMVVATLAAAVGAWAETWTDPDSHYTWTYQINGDTAEIYAAISPKPTGSLGDSLHSRRQACDEYRGFCVLWLQRSYERNDT